MVTNPRDFVAAADIGDVTDTGGLEATDANLDLDKLPAAVVSGTTLIDFSATPSMAVRAGVSEAMLFASRVATKATKPGDDADDWLATYTSSLSNLGFAISGGAVVNSSFKKKGIFVHQAIIPFLTVAFGGAAIGPIILAGLKNLQEMDKDAPWITLFDHQARRFDATEMHFAAVSSTDTDTTIKYAIARLHVATNSTTVLFFKLTNAEAKFESSTTLMTANNSLLAVMQPELRAKLSALAKTFIAAADI